MRRLASSESESARSIMRGWSLNPIEPLVLLAKVADEAANAANDDETELEKRKKRAARFGIELSMHDKAEVRKQRFGTVDTETEKNGPTAAVAPTKADAAPEMEISEEEKLKREKRMKRFGLERSGVEELKLQKEAKKAYVTP